MNKTIAVMSLLILFIFSASMYFAPRAQVQWTLTVISDYDSPNPRVGPNTYDDNASVTCNVTSPWLSGLGTQYVCTGWSGSGSVPTSGTGSSVTFNITEDSSITWNWKTQYLLTVTSGYDTPSGSGWYDNASTAYAGLASGTVPGGAGTQYVFTSWSGDASGTNYAQSDAITMDGAKTATADWKIQYYLTVSSAHGVTGGQGWYDSDATAYASVSPLTVSGGSGVQYVFTQWTGDASGSSSPSNPIVMSGPMTADANWKTQYYLTVSSGGHGIAGGQGWYDANSNAQATITPLTVAGTTGTQYVFAGWTGDASGPSSPSNNILMDGPKTATATWTTQYYLTVDSVYSTPTGSGWYDSGSTAYAGLASGTVSGGAGTQFVFTSWSGDASGTNYGQSGGITMNGPKTATANWKTQYLLTVTSPYDSPTPMTGWFDSGSSVTESVTSPTPGASGTQYVCTGWSGSGSVPTSGTSSSVTFFITTASSITWSWKIQYQVTFGQVGVGSDFPGTVVTVDSVNYGVSGLSVSFWFDNGSSHSFSFMSPLAVGSKQYVWSSTSGLSTLQSGTLTVTASGNVVGNYFVLNQVTFDQVGVSSDFAGAVVIVDSVNYSRSQLPVSFPWSVGSVHSFAFQSPLFIGSDTKQYLWTTTSGLFSVQSGSITITSYGNIIGNYKTQYFITVSSAYDSPSPVSGWFDSGSSITASVTSPVSGGSGAEYVCTGWSGSGSVPTSGTSSSVTFSMIAASSITWDWVQIRLELDVVSAHDSPSPGVGVSFYDNGSSVTCSVSSPVTEGGVVYVCTGWTGTGSVPSSGSGSSMIFTITQNSTITWNWHGNAVQYTLTVFSAHDNPSPAVGSHLYDEGDSVRCSVASSLTEGGVVYVCTGWVGTGSVPSSGFGSIVTFTMTQNSSVTWIWQALLWRLTVYSAHGSPSPSVGDHQYNDGASLTCSVSSPVVEDGVSYTCTGWVGTGSVPFSGSSVSVTFSITRSSSITWSWIPTSSIQRNLGVASAHGSPGPGVGDHLYNDGSSVTCSVASPVVEADVSYTCTGWVGTGSVPSAGNDTTTTFTITENSTITWDWVATTSVQWNLTVSSAHDNPSPGVGDNSYGDGSSVTCSVTSPVTEAGRVWTCTGWVGTGSVPSTGNGFSVTFTITESSTITWEWQVRQPTIGSCDGTGATKDVFSSDEPVYVTGTGYSPNQTYDIYVVSETDWVDGMTIPARIQDTVTSLSSNSLGNIILTIVRNTPLAPGKYDILVDVNGNGKYDANVDALYNNKIVATAGFSLIPEYLFGTILGLAGCFAALGAFRMYKRKRQ